MDTGFNGLDIALMIIMGYFFLRGIFRGVVKEVVAVLGLFVAFWVASIYWPMGEEHLRAIFDVEGQRGITSFIAIFIVVYSLISIISIFVDKIIKLTISPVISALLGAVVGTGKGFLVCAVLLAGAQTFLKPTETFFTESQLWGYFQPATAQAKAFMPEALRLIMEARKKLPPMPRSSGAQSAVPMDKVDWKTIQNLLSTRAEDISPAWRDKLRGVTSGESLSPEDLKRFVSDHPNIFGSSGGAPVAPAGTAGPSGATGTPPPAPAAPIWPQPATD